MGEIKCRFECKIESVRVCSVNERFFVGKKRVKSGVVVPFLIDSTPYKAIKKYFIKEFCSQSPAIQYRGSRLLKYI